MNARMYKDLEKNITEDLTVELRNDDDFDEDILAVKVRGAIREVIAKRCYSNSSFTDEQIIEDLENNYYSIIMNIARYDYNMIGAEGEISHTESNISRNWVRRETLFNGVYPFAKIF